MQPFIHENGYFIQIDDAKIYIEESGPSNGFPVIFLHGGLGTINDYDVLIEKITGNYRCIGIDTRGHGQSTFGSHALTYERLENDVYAILTHLKISQCSIIGFSDGGIVAYRLAIKHPTLVKQLISIGSDWNSPDSKLQTLFSKLTVEGWKTKFPNTVSHYLKLNPAADFDKLMKQVLAMWLDLSATGYPGKRVNVIQCDSLIIRGEHDPFMPLNACLDLRDEFPKAHLLNVPFCGHAAHVDQTDIVSMAINQFLKQ